MIALVRHGSYDMSTGSLTAEGRELVFETAQKIKATGRWTKIISSPSTRCRETAEILAEELQLSVTLDEHLADTSHPARAAELFEDGVVLVSHLPILRVLAPEWEPQVGDVHFVFKKS